MNRLLLAILLLAGVSVVGAQQPESTQLLQDPIRGTAKFADLIEAGDWADVSGEPGRWQVRLLDERDKQLLEEMVRRWQEGQAAYQQKVAELQPEINLLEDRLRILTSFARTSRERLKGDAPQINQSAEEREQTERRLQRLQDELAALRQANEPPLFMGTRWRAAELAQVMDIGEDYIGLQRDDYLTYYRLSDIVVIQRPVPRRPLDESGGR